MKIKDTAAPTVLSPSADTPQTTTHVLNLYGSDISLEMGITRQSNQSILLQTEDTSILGVLHIEVPLNLQEGEQRLTVDYQESAILNSDTSKYQHSRLQRYKSRVVDSAIRSLFARDRRSNVNVLIQVLSTKRNADTLGLSITLAGLLCQLAGFTQKSVIGATFQLQDDRKATSVPDWMMALTPDGFSLLQGSETQGYSPESLNQALLAQMEELQLQEGLETLSEFVNQHHQTFPLPSLSDRLPLVEYDLIKHPAFGDSCIDELIQILEENNPTLKNQRYQGLVDRLVQEVDTHESSILATLRLITSEYLRSLAMEQTRLDGRQLNEIRPLVLEPNKLPNSKAILVSQGANRVLVGVDHHMPPSHRNNPPRRGSFSCLYNSGAVNRRRRMGSRSDIENSLLIERAIESHTHRSLQCHIEVLSEESSFSAVTAALPGVITALAKEEVVATPIAGVSLGLIQDQDDMILLYDTSGDEEQLSCDLLAKVGSSSDGVTLFQCVARRSSALPVDALESLLSAGFSGCLQVLELTQATLEQFENLPSYEESVELAEQRVGRIIGKEGKNLKKFCQEHSVQINIDERNVAHIMGDDEEKVKKAAVVLRALGEPIKAGECYDGIVDGVKDFGAFVKIKEGAHSGLVHISELTTVPKSDATQLVSVGETLRVKILGVDQYGRLKLSHLKALDA